MSLDIIRQRLLTYHCQSPMEETQALKEIAQEIILMGLARQDFFAVSEFHGGTALRIFYGLQRFSEDLDFALLKPDRSFSLTPYLKNLSEELRAFGYEFEIKDRSKADLVIKKAFLKDDAIGKVFVLKTDGISPKIKIKLEVDTNPPLGAHTEIKYLDYPSPFGVRAKNLPSSFAGKLHALLCRPYVKGRDFYDFIWYVSWKTKVNVVLLENALQQNGPWQNQDLKIDAAWVIEALHKKIHEIDWKKASLDVSSFIKSHEQRSLALWGKDFFLAELEKMAHYL